MGRIKTATLTSDQNLASLTDLSRRWIDAVQDKRPPKVVILDLDNSESPVHDDQEGSLASLREWRIKPASHPKPARR